MPTTSETIERIAEAPSWNQRVAQIRLVPQHHGTEEHSQIFAEVARLLYVPYLAPDFAYIHRAPFYERHHFLDAYELARQATEGFTRVSEDELARVLEDAPQTLLPFRTILGLTREEFAHSTALAAEPAGLKPLTSGKVDSMERSGSPSNYEQARVAARTLRMVMDGTLFGKPPEGLLSKQAKPDTGDGWTSVQRYANEGVPFGLFLHQRHYGGAFRQVLDATSTQRGDLIEDAVEALFKGCGVHFIRTGAHNQAEIAARFEVRVTPAPASSSSMGPARSRRCWNAKAPTMAAPPEIKP